MKRYTNPLPAIRAMRSALLAARDAHPQAQRWAALKAAGCGATYGALLLEQEDKPGPDLTFTAGRISYRVRNNAARLDELAEAVAKCPGWTGRKTPRYHVKPEGGNLFRRPEGWALWVPLSLQQAGAVVIGSVRLGLDVSKRTISGRVPASWLVDLNAGPIVDEGAQEARQDQLLAA